MAQKPSKRKRKRKASRRYAKQAAKPQPSPSGGGLDCWYRADRDPQPQEWLGRLELERIEEVERYHRLTVAAEELPPKLKLHATLHVLVENQLAMDDPQEAAMALSRLRREGMSRHQAVHAMGWLVSRYMDDAASKKSAIDRTGYCRELKGFGIQRWLELAQGAPD
jgi:hypothetical protein